MSSSNSPPASWDGITQPQGLAGKPTIVARRHLASSALFNIESLDLKFSNGAERTFERLAGREHGAVMIVAMPDPNHVLLIREYAAGFEDYTLTLPKGLIDPGEDVITAANRELREECGVGAHCLEPVSELSLAPNYMRHRIQVVMASDLYAGRLEGDEPEPLEVETHCLDNIDALLMREDFHEARAIAALYIVRDRMRSRQAADPGLL